MKHFLFTRFCSFWPGSKTYDDPNWVSKRFDLYKKYNETSLSNQSNKDFTQLIFCDDRIEDHMIDYFNSVDYNVEVLVDNVVSATLAKKYLSGVNEPFIVTRYDSDDVIGNNYINEIQSNSNILEDDYLIDIAKIHTYCHFEKNIYMNYVYNSSQFISLVCKSGNSLPFWKSHNSILNQYNKTIRVTGLKAALILHDSNIYSSKKSKLIKKNVDIFRYFNR